MARVKIYTTTTCPWCVKAKDYLKSKKIAFEEVNVSINEQAREELIEKSGQLGVPVIEISGKGEPVIIIGFDKQKIDKAILTK